MVHDPSILEMIKSVYLPNPDWCFDAEMLDHSIRKEKEWDCPLKYSQLDTLPGVYLFVGYSDKDESPISLYAGKAVQLWNRMQSHWQMRNHSRVWLADFFSDLESGLDMSPIINVCVWRSDNRAALESEVLQKLRPKYCIRHE